MAEASSALDLMQSIDIVDEISKYVKLKSHKHELLGLCPFHTEDTASFYVNPSKQLFYCFGCQQGGNILNFRSKISGLTLQDALEALAKDYHIDLKHQPRAKGFRDVLSLASSHYQSTLKQSPKALEYLKNRQVTSESIQTFEVGFSGTAWNNLEKSSNFPTDDAMEIGLILKGDKGRYDRFRSRIMFPIRSHQGQIVGFGGRALGDEKPKYINSSESPIYHKSEILYGLYQALKAGVSNFIVVEGYMDVISLHQAGFKGAVASLGTAFTKEQFQLLAKYAEKVTFCFDGDEAGKNAANRAFHTILPYLRDQISCYFLILDQDDPDVYIQNHGREKFSMALDQATPLSDYLLQNIVCLKGKSLEDKANYVHQVRAILTKMPHSILQNLIIKKVGLAQKPIVKAVNKVTKGVNAKMVGLLFEHPDLIKNNQLIFDKLAAQLPLIVQKAYQCIVQNQSNLASFLQKEQIEASQLPMLRENDKFVVAKALSDLLKHYQLRAVEKKIQALMTGNMTDAEAQLLQELLKVKHLLKKKKIVLAIDDNS